MKNEPRALVLTTNSFPCGFLCAAVAFCRHLDSITPLIQPIKLETEHCGRQRSASDSSQYNALRLERSMTQDGALWGPGGAVGQPPAHSSLCSMRRGGKAGGGVHLLRRFPDLGGRELAPPTSEHLCGLQRKGSVSPYWEPN